MNNKKPWAPGPHGSKALYRRCLGQSAFNAMQPREGRLRPWWGRCRSLRAATEHAYSTGFEAGKSTAGAVDRLGQVLRQVPHLELAFGAFRRDPIPEHRQTERTRRRHARGLRSKRLLDALMIDALPDLFLHPHAPTPGSAAETALVMTLDLDQLRARDRFNNLTGRVVDVVPPAQVAGIVVGELSLDRRGRL